ncbi:hypothetical protein B0T10DRAFT_489391 [Thelonectria olida]|uniref:Secreted protein n=1 Tax=Thelonectria olida TaxID=1576542 RepID=A0A9P8W207_9HYPO|nr:hypothetical protein B0T10DRAFT_489391 [Thelonectria olida]
MLHSTGSSSLMFVLCLSCCKSLSFAPSVVCTGLSLLQPQTPRAQLSTFPSFSSEINHRLVDHPPIAQITPVTGLSPQLPPRKGGRRAQTPCQAQMEHRWTHQCPWPGPFHVLQPPTFRIHCC